MTYALSTRTKAIKMYLSYYYDGNGMTKKQAREMACRIVNVSPAIVKYWISQEPKRMTRTDKKR
jgi:hypothetical protein